MPERFMPPPDADALLFLVISLFDFADGHFDMH